MPKNYAQIEQERFANGIKQTLGEIGLDLLRNGIIHSPQGEYYVGAEK